MIGAIGHHPHVFLPWEGPIPWEQFEDADYGQTFYTYSHKWVLQNETLGKSHSGAGHWDVDSCTELSEPPWLGLLIVLVTSTLLCSCDLEGNAIGCYWQIELFDVSFNIEMFFNEKKLVAEFTSVIMFLIKIP